MQKVYVGEKKKQENQTPKRNGKKHTEKKLSLFPIHLRALIWGCGLSFGKNLLSHAQQWNNIQKLNWKEKRKKIHLNCSR